MSRRHSLRYFLVLPLLALMTVLLWSAIAPTSANISPPAERSPIVSIVSPETTLIDQGKAFYDAGKFAEAIDQLQQATQHYKTQGDSLRSAIALSNLALAHQALGQWSRANTAITESLRLLNNQTPQAQLQNRSFLSQALNIQGDLHLETGQAEQALETWKQAESIFTALNDRDGIAQNQINQAQALRALGYYRRSLVMLDKLRETLKTHPDSLMKVAELRSLGNALRLVGQLDTAQEVLQQSLEMTQRLPSTPDRAQEISAIQFTLGNTVMSQRDRTPAVGFYQAAARSSNPILKLQAQINLFSLWIKLDQIANAQPLLAGIQTQLADLPTSQATINARIHLGQALTKLSKPSDTQLAEQLFKTAAQDANRLGDRRSESYAIGNLGHVYEQTELWNDAQRLTQQALNLAQWIHATDISYRWHWQQGRLWKQQGALNNAIDSYDAAVGDLRSLRSDLAAVNPDVQFSFRETIEPIYRESVELLVRAPNGTPTEQNLDKARQRIEALQLAELDNFFREACLDSRTVSLDKVIDQENSKSAMIYPIILPNQLEVIVKIPQQPLHHHTIKISKQEVDRQLRALRTDITLQSNKRKMQATSQQVYRWLIAPIEADLDCQGVNTLVFVLDGALRSIPMAGLYDGKHYLVEKYAVALSLGLQLLPPKPLADEHLTVLAAGLIDPPLNYRKRFSSLPAIKSEFALIAKSGVTLQQLINQAFTSQALEKKVNTTGFNVVHLATHGQFSSQPEETYILADNGPITVKKLDELLRGRSQTRSEVIELLVLSACETAGGDDRATLGLAGVAVKAGARSTLASLWHVDDASTAQLMGEFYRELTSSKVTKAEALRRAQIKLIANPQYKDTPFWAAYVLVGNWL